MKYVYLCGRYERKAELLSYANRLKLKGCEIGSNWLYDIVDESRATVLHSNPMIDIASANDIAKRNFRDIKYADIFISFTEYPGTLSRGNRHIEFGYALGLAQTRLASPRLKVIIVGPVEQVLYADPAIPRFNSFEELVRARRPDIWQ